MGQEPGRYWGGMGHLSGFPKIMMWKCFFFCWKSALGRSAGKGFCGIASGALVGPCSAASASLTQGLWVPFFRREN